MFLVKRGDHGPRVVMIQGLLRAAGIAVTIDGSYGERTAAAVRTLQGRAGGGLVADGQVGIATWQAFERLTGYRIVNIVDAGDPAQLQRVTSGLRRAGDFNPIIMYGQSNAVASAIDQVMDRAGGSGTLAMVRFYSHGGQGMQNVAAGHDGSYMADLAGISLQYFAMMRSDFERLRDVLAIFGCVDLMGCSVGGGSQGAQLLRQVADAAGRPTEAGTDTQYSADVGYQPFNFEGTVRQVYPGGVGRGAWGRRVQSLMG